MKQSTPYARLKKLTDELNAHLEWLRVDSATLRSARKPEAVNDAVLRFSSTLDAIVQDALRIVDACEAER